MYDEVLAFEVSELPHRLPECLLHAGASSEIADAVDLPRLLRFDGERCSEEGEHQDDREDGPSSRLPPPPMPVPRQNPVQRTSG
jgi:hypothetical protein